jgi:hypothetical protein
MCCSTAKDDGNGLFRGEQGSSRGLRVSRRTERLDVQRKEREFGEQRDGRDVRDVVEAAQPQQQRPQLACPEVESTH